MSMILEGRHNIAVTAPQFTDLSAALGVYRTFRNMPALQLSDLLAFITLPSSEREDFLKLFDAEIIVRKNLYVKVSYS